MIKKISMFLCLLMMCTVFSPAYAANEETELFEINSKSALLMDAGTGTILYEKNIDEKLPPASVTKIMTMLLVMEAIDSNKITLNDEVAVSERASSMGGTQLYLEPGEVKTVEELMKGVAIRSANDATVALGEYVAGTEELFIKQMNNRAKELGMENTTFINTNGLPAEGHVTTAHDIALMSRELLKHKDIHKWLTTWMDTVVVGKRESPQSLVNTNKLINTYEGANGIKTGYTSEALHCLSASATRGNNTFIAVIMAAPSSKDRFDEAGKLLDYGFANYNTIEVAKKDQIIGTINLNKGKKETLEVVAKEDLKALVKKGEESKVNKQVVLPESIYAPVLKGEKIGEVVATVNEKEIGRVDIVSKENVEKASIIDILNKMFNNLII